MLNVVDGSFPSEFSTGKAELIEEERRLFYVALTRAQNDLVLMAPLKFHLTNQSRQGDAHVYGGRSRFLTEKVLKTLEPVDLPRLRHRRRRQLQEATDARHRRRRRPPERDVVDGRAPRRAISPASRTST